MAPPPPPTFGKLLEIVQIWIKVYLKIAEEGVISQEPLKPNVKSLGFSE